MHRKITKNIEHINKNFPQEVLTPVAEDLDQDVFNPLGNYTSYSAIPSSVELQEKEILELRFKSKKKSILLKKAIGKLNKRVGGCGIHRIIHTNTSPVLVIKGEKGGHYYSSMQRCGLIWLCPDCNYKITKARADELYLQLKADRERGETVLFITFTLQHKYTDKLDKLLEILHDAFNYANTHRQWKEIKEGIEFLRTLEVTRGSNGFHPHYHCLFVGGTDIINKIKILVGLFESRLREIGLETNEHTTTTRLWNGDIDDMKDYMFKGLLEQELTSGGLKKGKKDSKTFFELVMDESTPADVIREYMTAIKGKRQYHHSKGFFKDTRVKTDIEILHDDKALEIVCMIPFKTFKEMRQKGIAREFLPEIAYHGRAGARDLLTLYDIDDSFLDDPPVTIYN